MEEQKLTIGDGQAYDYFGRSVALSGNVAMIGTNEDGLGSVYVYRYNGSRWLQEQRLTPTDGLSLSAFGFSVALNESGNLAMIGARWEINSPTNKGAVYIFRYNGSRWLQEQKIVLPTPGLAHHSYIGSEVAISDNVALVQMSEAFIRGGIYTSSVYVFRHNGTNWLQEEILKADIEQPGGEFGHALAISGNVALIGMSKDSVYNGIWHRHTGSSYVFRYNDSRWVKEQRLTASDRAIGDKFGVDVAISGDTVLIGAGGDDSMRGSSYVFRYHDTSWIEEEKIVARDRAEDDYYSFSVALSGDTALISAVLDDDQGHNSGSAYIYQLSESVPPPPPVPCTFRIQAVKKFAISWSEEYCTIEPDPCFWHGCQAPPEIWLIPESLCLVCDLNLKLPKALDIALSFTLPEWGADPDSLKELFSFELYDLEGKAISHAEPSLMLLEGKETYGLRLSSSLPAGDYRLRITIHDEGFAKEFQGSPFAFVFDQD